MNFRPATLLFAVFFTISGQQTDLFAPVIPAIRAKWRLPVRVPAQLPDLGVGQDRIYAVLGAAGKSHYEIILGFTPDCTGGTACRVGAVSADAPPKKIAGKPVRLSRGIVGRFVDAVCGANCSDSTVSWKQGPASYTVGIKAGRLKELREMANSAIANQPE
ncbi:MAG: hypothetical protein M3Y07_09405 [Acidobacteriota bacterium]|nr:hypothetical protein [Acidobacteriota bacterium]